MIGEYLLYVCYLMFTQLYSSALTIMSIASVKQFLKARKTEIHNERQKKKQVGYFLLGGVVFLALLLVFTLERALPEFPSKVFNSIPVHVGITVMSYVYHYFFPSPNPEPDQANQGE